MQFDISKNFYIKNNDISKISAINTFTESLKNVLSIEPSESALTNLGCAMKKFHFNQIDTFNARLILKEVEASIFAYNRENLDELVVKVIPKPKNGCFDIEIYAKLINVDEIIKIKKTLKE